jgi:hypothetical protein
MTTLEERRPVLNEKEGIDNRRIPAKPCSDLQRTRRVGVVGFAASGAGAAALGCRTGAAAGIRPDAALRHWQLQANRSSYRLGPATTRHDVRCLAAEKIRLPTFASLQVVE